MIALCDWSGLSYEDAARALGAPIGTVRSRLSRGRRRLRELAGAGGPEQDANVVPLADFVVESSRRLLGEVRFLGPWERQTTQRFTGAFQSAALIAQSVGRDPVEQGQRALCLQRPAAVAPPRDQERRGGEILGERPVRRAPEAVAVHPACVPLKQDPERSSFAVTRERLKRTVGNFPHLTQRVR